MARPPGCLDVGADGGELFAVEVIGVEDALLNASQPPIGPHSVVAIGAEQQALRRVDRGLTVKDQHFPRPRAGFTPR